jgi:hypothetical protein
VVLRQGDLAAARKHLEESLAIRRELGDRWSIADSLESFAALAFAEEEPERTVLLWGAAEALRESIGTSQPAGERARHDRDLATVRAQLGETAVAALWSRGRMLSDEEAVACTVAGH